MFHAVSLGFLHSVTSEAFLRFCKGIGKAYPHRLLKIVAQLTPGGSLGILKSVVIVHNSIHIRPECALMAEGAIHLLLHVLCANT